MEERLAWVDDAIARLKREGVEADGQVASTRRAARTISGVARIRGVDAVVMDETDATGWRRTVEGDIAVRVAKVLRSAQIDVEIVPRKAEEAGARPAQRRSGR
jgi:K+-sensing histidine kinase KdpD